MKISKKLILLIIVLIFGVLIMGNFLFSIGNPEPKIVKLEKPISFVGLSIQTTDKNIYKDVEKLGNKFNTIKEKNPISNKKEPWAFVAVTKNYNSQTGTMEYIIGDVVTELVDVPNGLTGFSIPPVTCAVFPIKPKFSFLWGLTIGRTKKYIYTKWLPNSKFELDGTFDDFEYHDDKSLGKKPEISLYVAVKEKH